MIAALVEAVCACVACVFVFMSFWAPDAAAVWWLKGAVILYCVAFAALWLRFRGRRR